MVEKGYEALSIPAISASAGTSNQTFYEHFDNKREAFIAAFDVNASEALFATTRAFESADDGPAAIGAALRAMLEHIAGNEIFARLTFFDLATAGPVVLDHADAAMESFTAFLRPGLAPEEIDYDRVSGDPAGDRQRRLVGDPTRACRRREWLASPAGPGARANHPQAGGEARLARGAAPPERGYETGRLYVNLSTWFRGAPVTRLDTSEAPSIGGWRGR